MSFDKFATKKTFVGEMKELVHWHLVSSYGRELFL